MKNLLLLTLSLLLTLPTYASEKVFGNLEVESSLSVHDTADPIVFRVDSSTHRVGINVDSPSFPLEVSGAVVTNSTVTAGNLTMSSGSITDTLGDITFGDENLTTTGTGDFGRLVVDSTTLVVNATSYEDRVGIGTASPKHLLDVGGMEGESTFIPTL